MSFNSFHIGLSRWSAKNILVARFLFACTEILRVSIAFYLGKALISPLNIHDYLVICIALLSLSFVVFKQQTKRRHYKKYFQHGFIIMSCSWLLFFCTGSFFSNQASSHSNYSVLANDVQITQKSGLLAETLKKNKVDIKKKKMSFSKKRKLLYGLLFLLSIPLTFLGLVYACGLGCSGYAFFAFVFYFLSFGVLAAGISFLIKIFSKKKPRRYRDLNKRDKWKAWKPFFITWSVIMGALGLLILIING